VLRAATGTTAATAATAASWDFPHEAPQSSSPAKSRLSRRWPAFALRVARGALPSSPVTTPSPGAPNADRFPPLDPAVRERWQQFFESGDPLPGADDDGPHEYFAHHLGMVFEELRTDYARLRLPWDIKNSQPAGVVHGGAIASMIDMVVVPAIRSAYDGDDVMMSTIELHVQFLGPVVRDAVAEGWVVRRGRSIVFTQAEVRDHEGELAAVGTATYRVRAN